jgi:hypothetical protein
VHAGTDSFSPQLANELGAIDVEPLEIQPKNVEMPGMTGAGTIRRKRHFFNSRQGVIVHPGVQSAAFDTSFQFL